MSEDKMDFENRVKEYLKKNFKPGTKNWNDYESAKKLCIFRLEPSSDQYDMMIKIITDWLEL